jgi:hypothetical protein
MKLSISIILMLVIGSVILFTSSYYMKTINEFLPQSQNLSEDQPINISFSTDKEVYHSGELMNINVSINTAKDLENLTLKIQGIKDSRGNFRVYQEKLIDVKSPRIESEFKFQMPSCYGCAGVSPGEYEIVLYLISGNETLGNYTKTVNLEK